MSSKRSMLYDPDNDPWDDRALIQAYNDAIKEHTRVLKDPGAVIAAASGNSSTPSSKKRSRSTSKSHEKQHPQEVVDDEEEEYEEEVADAPQGAPFGYPHSSPYHGAASASWVPSPYQHNAYAPTYPSYQYSPMNASSKPQQSRSMSRSKSASKLRGSATNGEENDNDDADQQYDEAEVSDMEESAPKTKRRKLASHRESASNTHTWNGPMGLQPPTMGDVPLGYYGGYQTPWWANAPPPAPWAQQSQYPAPPTQDNATLWAYYYYGYAMGQYDAYNHNTSSEKHS